MRVLFLLLTWGSLAFIAFATLSPAELRPDSGQPVGVEHLAAFACTALLMGLAPFRSPLWLRASSLILFAGVLEIAQFLTTTRHASLTDFTQKAIGVLFGFALAWAVRTLHERYRHPDRRN